MAAITEREDLVSEPTAISVRIRKDQLAAIDKRARAVGLSRNAYMVRAALGELTEPSEIETRLEDVEARLGRLERLEDLG